MPIFGMIFPNMPNFGAKIYFRINRPEVVKRSFRCSYISSKSFFVNGAFDGKI